MRERILHFLIAVDWSAWIPICVNVVLVLLTGLYVWITWCLLRRHREPHVVVSAIHDSSRPSIIMLIIRNIGNGVASNVAFKLSRPIPARAFGWDIATSKVAEKMNQGPLVRGIPTLAPGDERRITWGQYGGLLKNLGKDPVTVRCFFKHGRRVMPPVDCELDIMSFENTAAHGSELKEIQEAIKSVAKEIKSLK